MFICKRRLGNDLDLIVPANPLENVLTFEQMLKESTIRLCNHIKLTKTEMLVVLFFRVENLTTFHTSEHRGYHTEPSFGPQKSL
jgi:hypothetical protein